MMLYEVLNNTITPAGNRVIVYLDVKRLVPYIHSIIACTQACMYAFKITTRGPLPRLLPTRVVS